MNPQIKMNRMRMRIAERLKESQNSAASLTTFNEIDMSSLMSFRSKYKDEVLKRHNVKIGFMSAFAKACVLALQEIPAANASIENAADGKGQEIVYRDYVDLSVAVATPKGLVTPVVRNAEGLSMIGVEREIAALGSKARDGKLTLEDMAGGTFTMYGFVYVCGRQRWANACFAARMEAYLGACTELRSSTSRKRLCLGCMPSRTSQWWWMGRL